MIQKGSYLNVLDNSGARKVMCIKILNSGYKQRYASIGSVILVSIKSIKFSKNIKVKKGEIHRAVIIKTRTNRKPLECIYRQYFENSVILLNKQHKLLGTRIFDRIPKELKTSKFLKLVTISPGISK